MSDMNWNVCDTLVYENSWICGRAKIERETPKTFVLENGDKVRKGNRYPIGQHGFNVPCYYSINEPEGQRILARRIREEKVRKLSNFDWKNLTDEKIDLILKILT